MVSYAPIYDTNNLSKFFENFYKYLLHYWLVSPCAQYLNIFFSYLEEISNFANDTVLGR